MEGFILLGAGSHHKLISGISAGEVPGAVDSLKTLAMTGDMLRNLASGGGAAPSPRSLLRGLQFSRVTSTCTSTNIGYTGESLSILQGTILILSQH